MRVITAHGVSKPHAAAHYRPGLRPVEAPEVPSSAAKLPMMLLVLKTPITKLCCTDSLIYGKAFLKAALRLLKYTPFLFF